MVMVSIPVSELLVPGLKLAVPVPMMSMGSVLLEAYPLHKDCWQQTTLQYLQVEMGRSIAV